MTLREAADILISQRPHIARWLDEIRSGARVVPEHSATEYLCRNITDAAAAFRVRRSGSPQAKLAANTWADFRTLDVRRDVARQILVEATGFHAPEQREEAVA